MSDVIRTGPVLLAALSVALSARCKSLTSEQVTDMRTKTEELMPIRAEMTDAERQFRSAVILFCTMHIQHQHDRAAMAELGDELQRGLDRFTRTAPPDAGRVDIHG